MVVNYNSRVLSVSPAKLEIPPREVFDVAIRLTPTEIEAEYRKRITIMNKRNRTNEFVLWGHIDNILLLRGAIDTLLNSAYE